MRNFSIVLLFLFSTSILANSRGQILNNISRLSERIQIVAPNSEASNEELRMVQADLRDILDRLRNRGGGSGDCLEFTLDIYERSYGGSTALRKAKEACEKINDLDLTKFVYEVLLESFTDRSALDRAIDKTEGRNFNGKSDELKFVFSVYKEVHTPRFAIERALDKVEPLPRNSLRCLEISYRTLSRTHTPKFAMDKAIESCMN